MTNKWIKLQTQDGDCLLSVKYPLLISRVHTTIKVSVFVGNRDLCYEGNLPKFSEKKFRINLNPDDFYKEVIIAMYSSIKSFLEDPDEIIFDVHYEFEKTLKAKLKKLD